MKAALTVVVLVCSAAISSAQERLADQLRKGIVQEEANQNLEKAIAAYQSVVTQFDEDRKVAATALFRLAECYRKTGKREQAVAAYQRVVREFPDQAALVEPSRQQLASTYGIPEPKLARSTPPAAPREPREEAISARERDILARQLEVKVAQRDLAAVQDKMNNYQIQIQNGFGSTASTEYRQLQRDLEVARARLELAQVDLREVTTGPRPAAAQPREVTPEMVQKTQIEMDALQKQIAATRQKADLGLIAPAKVQELQTQLEIRSLEYQQQVKELQASEAAARENQALKERRAKSLEAEIALIKERIAAIEKRVAAGTVPGDSPELLQLRRDLLGLQRNLDELKTSIKR